MNPQKSQGSGWKYLRDGALSEDGFEFGSGVILHKSQRFCGFNTYSAFLALGFIGLIFGLYPATVLAAIAHIYFRGRLAVGKAFWLIMTLATTIVGTSVLAVLATLIQDTAFATREIAAFADTSPLALMQSYPKVIVLFGILGHFFSSWGHLTELADFRVRELGIGN